MSLVNAVQVVIYSKGLPIVIYLYKRLWDQWTTMAQRGKWNQQHISKKMHRIKKGKQNKNGVFLNSFPALLLCILMSQ